MDVWVLVTQIMARLSTFVTRWDTKSIKICGMSGYQNIIFIFIFLKSLCLKTLVRMISKTRRANNIGLLLILINYKSKYFFEKT